MLIHYLKIAFRNMWKYKGQTLISTIGLAVGFTCFALATLWIRYEMSYDSFHDGADRLYIVRMKSGLFDSGISSSTPFPMASYLKETFPEIEDACFITSRKEKIEIDGITHEVFQAWTDSSLMRMFNIEMISGSLDFLIPDSKNVAITEEFSKMLWGETDPLGKQLTISRDEYTICAVVKGWSKHSNFYFQLLAPVYSVPEWVPIWNSDNVQTLIRLKQGIDVTAFAEKLYEHKIEKGRVITNMMLAPLTSLRYDNPLTEIEVEYKYIIMVALSGGLLILCSLFNYLTLFISRFRIRIKELALRIVNGASGLSLFVLLSVEFILTLIVSLLFGLLFIRLSLTPFSQLSNVYMDVTAIYGETVLYIGAIILFSLLTFFLIIKVFLLQNLHVSITRIRNSVFRKASVILQLIISIGFIFCTVVIVKQIYFLRNTDIGIDYKNTALVSLYPAADVFENQLQQIPEITETLAKYNSLVPGRVSMFASLVEWEDMPQTNDEYGPPIGIIASSEAHINFYNLRLAEGEFLNDHAPAEHIMINEATAKLLGWNQSVGKKLKLLSDTIMFTVTGVVKDFYNTAPTIPPNPVVFIYNYTSSFQSPVANFLIKYHEGSWNDCKQKIEQLAKQQYPNATLTLTNAEETYNGYMKSEAALMKLLGIVSFVCIIISVFGLFSLVSLTCEERRKEIAIRKINGASVQNILAMYFKEYFMLLAIGAVIILPIGYTIMKRWIENYIKQTSINAWIYLSIILALGVIITLCVGWRVYKTSTENPAEVVKAE